LTATLFTIAGLRFSPRSSAGALALLGLAGYVAGCAGVAQWEYLAHANRDWLEWAATVTWVCVGWAAYMIACVLLAKWMDGVSTIPRLPSLGDVIESWGRSRPGQRLIASLGFLRGLMIIGTAYVSLALAYDGRGRDFPLALIALPVLGFALIEWAASSQPTFYRNRRLANEERILSAMILLTTLFVAWNETMENTRAILWCTLCVLLVATLWLREHRTMNPDERAEDEPEAAELKRV
jgi:hypothetical protein